MSAQARWGSPTALVVYGVLGSVVIGALSAERPEYAIGALLVAILVAVAWYAPRTILTLSLVSFAWYPERIFTSGFGNYAQEQKLLILFAALVLAQRRGYRTVFALPFFAYLTLALLSALGGKPAPGLTVHQMLQSLLTLTACWLLAAVRWRRDDVFAALKVLAWVPLACLVLGVVFAATHRWEFFDTTSSPERLEGALIAPFLAATAATATVGSLILTRIAKWRYGVIFTVLNVAILALTITRGAMIAGGLALIPSVVRVVRSWGRIATPAQLLRVVLVAVIAVGVVVFVVGQVEKRDSQTVFVPGQGEVKGNISSGRTAAWAFAYRQAKVSILFGRGLGSAPIVGAEYNHSFLAQHNEYLRMLLEGGFVGGLIVLLTIVAVIAWAVAHAPPLIRLDLALFALGLAIYSFTDNTLSNPQLAMPMLLIFAFGAALGANSAESPPSRSLRTRSPGWIRSPSRT